MTDLRQNASTETIDSTKLQDFDRLHIDDVIEYVNAGLRAIPGPMELYNRYLRQRWDVNELDFSQDAIDWREKMTQEERDTFLIVSQGFHHGERNVEAELPAFMMGADEEDKVFISSHIEDEARHTVFFDRFFREGVQVQGESIMDVLDASYEFRTIPGAGATGLLSYVADELARNPYDAKARVRYATIYHLFIEGVGALSAMKITLGYCRQRGFLPGYYKGFTATCRDEARHVQYGMGFLQSSIRKDPSLAEEIYDMLRIILELNAANNRQTSFAALGLNTEELRRFNIIQMVRKLTDVGIPLPDDLKKLIDSMFPEITGG
ncbi:MAG TPA: ribonucleotide-diphosphate reductase subunit beta [Streptosporangiaceae bacterium]|jgi:ribonucleoside-diphosphate reductase beta chain